MNRVPHDKSLEAFERSLPEVVNPTPIPQEVDVSRDLFNAHSLGIMAALPSAIWQLPDDEAARELAATTIDDVLESLKLPG